ncbi:hypothetical protein CZ765_01390 [Corynebacterium casei]|nr:hypothetical protein CZ765_01390 [Corynebacterium casei]
MHVIALAALLDALLADASKKKTLILPHIGVPARWLPA